MEIAHCVSIIIPVHNRREITLRCLATLRHQGVFKQYSVIVVDDGSTDGTALSIQTNFPEVRIVPGDGNLWWTGAIALGMKVAYDQGADYFLWLNDDVVPAAGAISTLVTYCQHNSRCLASAQCYADTEFKQPTYGGQVRRRFSTHLIAAADSEVLSCDCLSGNLVCLPRSVVDDLGFPPADVLPHCSADIVYTWEAKKAGYDVKVIGDAKAVCELNPLLEGWSSSAIPMLNWWRSMGSYRSSLHVPTNWRFCLRFYGWQGIYPFCRSYIMLTGFTLLRAILPISIVKRLKRVKDRISEKF